MTRQPGQTLVVFALLVPLVLGLIGLLYSVGFVLVQRRALQAAADAASTAATWEVLQQVDSGGLADASVNGRLQQYAVANGVAAAQVSAVYTDASGAPLVPSAAVGRGGIFPSSARGVQVTTHAAVGTLLPGFVGANQIVTTATSAAAAVGAASPATASQVVPLAVSAADARTALAVGGTYNLYAPPTPPCSGCAPMLDYAATDPSAFLATDEPVVVGYCCGRQDVAGPLAILTNLQYWSDGLHRAGTLKSGAHVALAPTTLIAGSAFSSLAEQTSAFEDVVSRGLLDRMAASGGGPTLVNLPVWDTFSGSLHLAGFARLRLTQVTATSAQGVFVPYAVSAFGVAVPSPSPEVGARVVRIVG